jgi:uncharacterized phage protein (TIGR01671 family)
MIREIKFRAWDILSKRMMEDIELWLIPYGVLFPHTPDQRCLELMQFTGLLDKNGKEIYEGDVIQGNHKDLWIVIEMLGGLSMLNKRYYGQQYNDLIAIPVNTSQTASWLRDSKVIGNIFQNPELLEALE